MCLIAFSWRQFPDSPLVFVGNRDEFHDRPTAPADWWDAPPGILAGRDLRAGGTWLGLGRQGRFAVVTNFREPNGESGRHSRGRLVTDFLSGMDTADYLAALAREAADYAGFNLIYFDGQDLGYFSNRGLQRRSLEPGLYALSNHFLDTPWPKVTRLKQTLARQLAGAWDPDALAWTLADRRQAPDEELPDTGIGHEWEKRLSSAFIVSPAYGTRCTTVIRLDGQGSYHFLERSFDPQGRACDNRVYRFHPDNPA